MNEVKDEIGCSYEMGSKSSGAGLHKTDITDTDPTNFLKCGEIYWSEKFRVNCIQCNQFFIKISEFLNHILKEHLKIENNNVLEEFLNNDNFDYAAIKSEDDLFLNDSFQTDDDNLRQNVDIFVNKIELNDKVLDKIESNRNEFPNHAPSLDETLESHNTKLPDDINTTDLPISKVSNVNDKTQRNKEKPSQRSQRKTSRGNRLRKRSRNKLNTLNKSETELPKVKKKRIREKITCEICGKIKNKHQIKIHLKSHDKSRYIYKCTECMKSFISEKSLELHQKSFHIADGRQVNCTYEQCKRKFVSESLLKEHLKSHINPTERPFKCELCPDKGFLYEKKLNTHIKIYHVNGKSLKCNQCDRTFYLEYNLNRHKLVHQNKVKPFECDQCPSRFVSYQNLARHKKNHTDIKDYLCEICKKEFAYFQAYRAHMKYHGIICSIDPKKVIGASNESN